MGRSNDQDDGGAIILLLYFILFVLAIWLIVVGGFIIGYSGFWWWVAWKAQRSRKPLVPNGTFDPKNPPLPPTYAEKMEGLDGTAIVLVPASAWGVLIGIFIITRPEDYAALGILIGGLGAVAGVVAGIRFARFFQQNPPITHSQPTRSSRGVPFEPVDYEPTIKTETVTESAQPYVPVPEGYVYTLHLPRETVWNAELATRFIEQLVRAYEPLVFRLRATAQEVVWEIVDVSASTKPAAFEEVVRSFYPDIELTSDSSTLKFEDPFFRYVLYYRQRQPFLSPLPYAKDLKDVDPVSGLTQAMSSLRQEERICYTLAIAGLAEYAYEEGEVLLTEHPGGNFWTNWYKSKPPRMPSYDAKSLKTYEEKIGQGLYQAVLLVQVDSPEAERVRDLAQLVHSHIVQYERPDFNGLAWVERVIAKHTVEITTQRLQDETSAIGLFRCWLDEPSTVPEWKPARLILEPRELAALWHMPYKSFSAPRIRWSAGGQAPVPSAFAETHTGIYLGEGKYQGKRTPVFLNAEDRVTHLNIIGKTGMGKSTLLHRLIHQDIQNGEGVAVIDPHGTLIRALLQKSIPPEREKEVVILDLANLNYPPPLNPLRGHQSYVGMGRVINVIEKLFAGTEQYARLSKYLRASVGLLQADAQPTMRDLSRVFTDENYRENLLEKTDNALVTDVWDEYDLLSAPQQAQIREPVLSRIAPFYGNPALYPILCHPDVLDFRRFIEAKKIILISLAISEERVPEQERNLVGALVVSLLQMSGMQDNATPFYVYIDEVQRFVTTSLSIVLSEARKFGLSLTIANQFLGQLGGQTLEAVMGNVGTTVCFRCSPDDARALATHMKPQFDAEALVNLDRYQMAVKLQRQGMTQPAFTVWSPEPLPTPDDAVNREQRIRALSTEQYTPKSLAEVEAWLKTRYPRRKTNRSGGEVNDEETYYD